MNYTPNNIPYYPQYGYSSPVLLNQVYPDPNTYYTPPYSYPEQLYYPVDEFGRVAGPATKLPPIVNRQSYPYSDYMYPNRDQMMYDDYYYRSQYSHPYYPPNYPQPRRERLPSIHPNESYGSTRPTPRQSDEVEYPQFLVNDLTARDSPSPRFSNNDAVRRDRYYDKLRKNYRY